jgi:hypothetical protein
MDAGVFIGSNAAGQSSAEFGFHIELLLKTKDRIGFVS